MAIIDKEKIKEISKNHPAVFKDLDTEDGKKSLRRAISICWTTTLLVKAVLIGGAWLFLASIERQYGELFLLVMALWKTKQLVDQDFEGVEDVFLEEAAEIASETPASEPEAKDEDKDSEQGSREDAKHDAEAKEDEKSVGA